MDKKITKTAIANRTRLNVLYKNISGYIHSARRNVLRTVDTEQVKAYWLIGKDIVEEEQRGENRARYGTFLLEEISFRLTKEFGAGFGLATVKDMRRFYLVYSSIRHALRGEFIPRFKINLSWIHYRALMREDRPEIRDFY